MKKTLREIIGKYNLNVCLTPNQNIILCDIRNAWKRPITKALVQGGFLVSCTADTILTLVIVLCDDLISFKKFFPSN